MSPVTAPSTLVVNHTLKSWPAMFAPLVSGQKQHDVRSVTDRSFRVGDLLRFREWEPTAGDYTGRECVGEITYITSAEVPCPLFENAVHPDFAILSVRVIEA